MKCNRCGESILRQFDKGGPKEFYGLVSSYEAGYLSYALEDTFQYEFALCEKCMKWLFDNEFKIPVKKTNYMGGIHPDIDTADIKLDLEDYDTKGDDTE